jgi:hypothetical protein
MSDDGFGRARGSDNDESVDRLGEPAQVARNLYGNRDGRRCEIGGQRLGEGQRTVKVESYRLVPAERVDPLEDSALGLFSNASDPARPSRFARGPQIGNRLDAEGGVERGDSRQAQPGNAAQLERSGRQALPERVERF